MLVGADVQVRCSFEVFGADFTGRIYVFAIVRDLVFGKIEAERPIFLPELDREWQADVTKTYDCDSGHLLVSAQMDSLGI